jgi:glycosyltransferase involved in cell wall biosynthesis
MLQENSVERAHRDSFVMVLAGSLTRTNGIEMALEAMTNITDHRVRLFVAGRGPLVDSVLAASRRDTRIKYVGFLSLQEVLKLYREADLLLNLRLTRALHTRYFFPSKLMELLASGTPVLSTCPAHVREEFSEIAYLLEEETSGTLASQICDIVKEIPSQRQARGQRAQALIREQKSWSVQGRRIANFIRRIATGEC